MRRVGWVRGMGASDAVGVGWLAGEGAWASVLVELTIHCWRETRRVDAGIVEGSTERMTKRRGRP